MRRLWLTCALAVTLAACGGTSSTRAPDPDVESRSGQPTPSPTASDSVSDLGELLFATEPYETCDADVQTYAERVVGEATFSFSDRQTASAYLAWFDDNCGDGGTISLTFSLSIHTGDLVIGSGEMGAACSTDGTGYSDIGEGTQITVLDPSGTIIGAGTFFQGGTYMADDGSCMFITTIDVPPDVAFYTIDMGSRGKLTYSLADMQETLWWIRASLGD